MAVLPEKLPQGGIWLPAKEESSSWLLVALHGSRGSASCFSGLDQIFRVDALNYLYVNGPIPYYSSYVWYDNTPSRYAAYQVIEEVLRECEAAGYPAEKTFLLGFSQGAALTIEYGVRHRHKLAGYIAISGRVEELSSIANEGRAEIIERGDWLITHGTQDYNLSVDVIRLQVQQMREMGFTIDYREYDKIHEMEAAHELCDIGDWIQRHM